MADCKCGDNCQCNPCLCDNCKGCPKKECKCPVPCNMYVAAALAIAIVVGLKMLHKH
jgi:hypothetical protein